MTVHTPAMHRSRTYVRQAAALAGAGGLGPSERPSKTQLEVVADLDR